MKSPSKALLVFVVCLYSSLIIIVHGWEWADFFDISGGNNNNNRLSMEEISIMRVRDIKRRLARTHGFSAEELGRILDKKDLIEVLAFEEHKVAQIESQEFQRALLWKATIVTVIVGLLTLFWPLLKHVYEVAYINFVVYTDRKRLEARRCLELKSVIGSVGVACMFVVDVLQIWLTGSILLSWVMKSNKYFFPMPSLPIRPAAMMGGQVANGPLARYGINVAPMVIAWGFRFLQGKLEKWTGKALSKSHRAQTKTGRRDNETPQEREARRAARRARRVAREEAEQQKRRQQERDVADVKQEELGAAFGQSLFDDMASIQPSQDEKRTAAAAAAEARLQEEPITCVESYSALDELD